MTTVGTGTKESAGDPKPLPTTIAARLHPDALRRVTRFFNATIKDVLVEMLQNARRSGATKVFVTTTGDQTRIVDDGCGIGDPAAILAFGQSDWNEAGLEEDPAGMGFYSLARRGCRVASRTKGGRAWAANLDEKHFTGAAAALVQGRHVNDAPPEHGTSITFNGTAQKKELAEVAMHFPLPVTLDGGRMRQHEFLPANKVIDQDWNGLRIGCHAGTGHTNNREGRFNFHGVQLTDSEMPVVVTRTQTWSASVDVQACPGLELVLPARKEPRR